MTSSSGRICKSCAQLGRVLRASDYKVTAVIVDDLLIDLELGDTTGRIFAIVFDLGTTTVVATLLDLSTGAPVAVQSMLNKQQSFRRRRHLADQRHHDRRSCPRAARRIGAGVARRARTGGLRGRRRHPSEVYEIALAGNATIDSHRVGIDPSPLGVAPFIMSTRLFPEILATDLGVKSERTCPGGSLSCLRRLRRWRHRRRAARLGHGQGLADTALFGYRHQL